MAMGGPWRRHPPGTQPPIVRALGPAGPGAICAVWKLLPVGKLGLSRQSHGGTPGTRNVWDRSVRRRKLQVGDPLLLNEIQRQQTEIDKLKERPGGFENPIPLTQSEGLETMHPGNRRTGTCFT